MTTTKAPDAVIDLDPAYTVGPLQRGAVCCEPVPLIGIENLTLRYGTKLAFEAVNFDVQAGCITALIGPSGCGKTSLLSSINRMTDLTPNCTLEGRIMMDGRNLLDPTVDVQQLRRRIGMVFQRPNPFPLSIRRNIEMPLREHGITHRRELADRTERSLRDVGLWDEVGDRLETSALGLSGGQQQRLCIARAIALEPSVLLMDEPCSALDPISSGVVEDLIERLRGTYTVVIVTHNLAQARRIANYAGFFWVQQRVGTLIEFGRSRAIFDTPLHELTAAYVNGTRG
jgi:phosphate transport system ATP-binding protein